MSVERYRRMPARNDIVISLLCIPLYGAAAGKYGLRILLALAVSVAVGALVETLAARMRKKEMTAAGFPCWLLMPLVLPPVFPLWMLGVSVLFGTVVGVAFFGGYGKHLASPVALGWTFAALSYPQAFGFGWSLPFPGFAAGFSRYAASVLTIDDPVVFLETQRYVPLWDILVGNAPSTPGMAVPLLVAACGVVVLVARAVDVKSSVIFLLTVAALGIAFHGLMPERFADPRFMLTGNLLIAGLFILPDRRISPRTQEGRMAAALLAGIVAFLVRNLSTFPCGVMFAVLFANAFSPIIDEGFLKARYGTRAPAAGK
jgi:Na+-translocating ferredoxin:NAD+ oxidoreductase RnfD subunit